MARRAALGVAAAGFAALAYTWCMLPDVGDLRTVNPNSTAFMRLRVAEALAAGKPLRLRQRWVGYEQIAQPLKQAVLVSEDAKFWQHDGVDYEELRISLQQDWASRRFLRGASTLTQQLAKNLYLGPSRTPTRKFEELVLTRRLEAELTKRRIFELYLNLIEWGDGVWGAEAASRAYFGVPASALSAPQAALLAAAIVNPRLYNPAHPNEWLLRRQQLILSRMGEDLSQPQFKTQNGQSISEEPLHSDDPVVPVRHVEALDADRARSPGRMNEFAVAHCQADVRSARTCRGKEHQIAFTDVVHLHP
jgi:monofunctional biosynthetic peptidoglycan transglycosylase